MIYSLEDEQLLFASKHGRKDKEEEIEVPLKLSVGVSVALVGLFLIVVPVVPLPVKSWGKEMMVYGVGIALDACYDYDGNKNKP